MKPSSDSPAPAAGLKFGCVLLAGLPNAGKSTLLNALVGERLSIVTRKAQTTWRNVPGIRTERGVQIVFVDTPGLVSGESLFERTLEASVEKAAHNADAAIVVVDGAVSEAVARLQAKAVSDLAVRLDVPCTVAVNKADHRRFDASAAAEAARRAGLATHCVSGKTGTGVDVLLEFARAHVPAGPFHYPVDEVSVEPVRFFLQELVREAVFEQYSQEVPYGVAVRVEEFRGDQSPVYVAVSLNAERASQKGILVGRKGVAVKRLGVQARRKMEDFLGRRVYLDLRVKVWPGWRRKKEGLMEFGHAAPRNLG